MTKRQKWVLFGLRIALGWLMLYAGYEKFITPNWSAAFYLKDAATFPGFYHWLMSASVLPIVNLATIWGEMLIGASLILGVFVPISSVAGAIMMMAFYFPALKFPHPDAHSFIVGQHIIYALGFLVLWAFEAGRDMNVEKWFKKN